ncbi:MAG: hypothetical protein U5K51_06245 [Flavobacteriaceae bacterium]|nr:hypothetical protein [Flavobacteriaceae bacterium]
MMKNYFPLFLFLLGAISNQAQTIIAKQSFEFSGDTWQPLQFSTQPCTSGGDTWNYRTSLRTLTPSDGNQFWGYRRFIRRLSAAVILNLLSFRKLI